jgi:hypothetical protein
LTSFGEMTLTEFQPCRQFYSRTTARERPGRSSRPHNAAILTARCRVVGILAPG